MPFFGDISNAQWRTMKHACQEGTGQGRHLGLVEAKVLGPGDGGLGRGRQVLARAAPRLDLRVDALQHLRPRGPARSRPRLDKAGRRVKVCCASLAP